LSGHPSADETETLLKYLSQTRSFDVTAYKPATLLRRIHKRMKDVGADTVGAYQDRLQVHPEEFAHLFNTILINVTAFFRDPEQWQYLAGEIVPLVCGPDSSREIRVWSAGCASGEEAYSVAMLFAEHLGTGAFRQRVKIYATDVDDDALANARSASYTVDDVESVPQTLREKYFDSSGARYSFRQDLRRSLIFGRHDLVQDAPISRVDLLLCRNTLMYFTSEIQGRVLSRLNYALKDDGYLMLGKAEMLLTHGDLFRPVDMKQRLFTKVPSRGVRDRFGALGATEPEAPAAPVGRGLMELAGDIAPFAHIVIDEPGRLVGANATARLWFGIVEGDIGRPMQDLEVSYRPLDLRTLISRARAEQQTVTVQNVERALPGNQQAYLDVAATPLRNEHGSGVSVTFNDVTRFHDLRAELDRSRHDLETAYEELQSTNEELETTNEELQSTIEELETTNEELQSSNEELETMNEELESTNAELQAINDELRRRTDEVDQVNNFVNSVLESLELGVIVIDRQLKVRMWNNHSEQLWGVKMSEAVGEPLVGLDIGLPIAQTLELVKRTLSADGNTHELTLDAVNRRGRQIRCRIVASTLTLDGGQQGVVLLVEQAPEP
jgi:two-component system, chemotaxis family, CheB/CheR fusion protein